MFTTVARAYSCGDATLKRYLLNRHTVANLTAEFKEEPLQTPCEGIGAPHGKPHPKLHFHIGQQGVNRGAAMRAYSKIESLKAKGLTQFFICQVAAHHLINRFKGQCF